MSNVAVYPSSRARIDSAIENIFLSIRRANLEDRITKLATGIRKT